MVQPLVNSMHHVCIEEFPLRGFTEQFIKAVKVIRPPDYNIT